MEEKHSREAKELHVVRNHKDTVFRMLYKDREKLLELYNALNGTAYEDTSAMEICTLENAIYMGVKNDVSFLFDSEMNLYEHQSTFNPNMPLRDLLYIARQLEKYARGITLYSSKLQKIPVPRFVECIRKYAEDMEIAEAVDRAVTECVRNDILADFLSAQWAEVIAMSIFEYNEEEEMKKIRADEFQVGREAGKAEGKAEAVLELLEELGQIPPELRQRILSESDLPVLKKWIKEAAKAESVRQFMDHTGI